LINKNFLTFLTTFRAAEIKQKNLIAMRLSGRFDVALFHKKSFDRCLFGDVVKSFFGGSFSCRSEFTPPFHEASLINSDAVKKSGEKVRLRLKNRPSDRSQTHESDASLRS
jgi:hypothetical protein